MNPSNVESLRKQYLAGEYEHIDAIIALQELFDYSGKEAELLVESWLENQKLDNCDGQ